MCPEPRCERSILCAAALAAALCGCVTARVDIHADSAHYPISLSQALNGPDGEVVVLGHELESVGPIEIQQAGFSFLYGATGPSMDLSAVVDREVAARSGDGVVGLSIVTRACASNYLWPICLLPLWPGCMEATVKGVVVRLRKAAAERPP